MFRLAVACFSLSSALSTAVPHNDHDHSVFDHHAAFNHDHTGLDFAVPPSQAVNEMVEISVSDYSLDQEGSLPSSSFQAHIEASDEGVKLNGVSITDGLAQIRMLVDVKTYILTSLGNRKCDKTDHKVEVSVVTHMCHHKSEEGKAHLKLQVTEYNGVSIPAAQTTTVLFSIGSDGVEVSRTVLFGAIPFTTEETEQAKSSQQLLASSSSSSDSSEDVASKVEEKLKDAGIWVKTEWKSSTVPMKTAIVSMCLAVLVILLGLFSICCCQTKRLQIEAPRVFGMRLAPTYNSAEKPHIKYSPLKTEA